jgi:hypothetical protein
MLVVRCFIRVERRAHVLAPAHWERAHGFGRERGDGVRAKRQTLETRGAWRGSHALAARLTPSAGRTRRLYTASLESARVMAND